MECRFLSAYAAHGHIVVGGNANMDKELVLTGDFYLEFNYYY